jgi:hypothetical protein
MPQDKNDSGGGQGPRPFAPSISLDASISWERLRQADLGHFSGVRVLVAGDFMLDEYIWGKVSRISPEAPVTVVEVERETRTLGGAGNVVNNLAALGAKIEVIGLVGEDPPAAALRQELARLQVEAGGLFTDPARHTTRKTRVYGGQQQVVRIDRETRTPAPASFTTRALEYLKKKLPGLAALILSTPRARIIPPMPTPRWSPPTPKNWSRRWDGRWGAGKKGWQPPRNCDSAWILRPCW